MTSTERHPLDDDNDDAIFGAADPSTTSVSHAHRSLQIIAVYAIVITAVLVVITGVIAGNAAPSSPAASIGSGLNRLFMVVLLVEFALLLLSYRWQQFTAGIGSATAGMRLPARNPYSPEVTPSASSNAYASVNDFGTFSDTQSTMFAEPRFTKGAGARGVRVGGLSVLYTANLSTVAVLWCLLMLSPDLFVPWLVLGIFLLIIMSLGLFITIAVFHTGVIRGYAIGVAAGIALLVNQAVGSLGGLFGMYGMNYGQSYKFGLGIPFAIGVSLVVLSGLICGTYVGVLERLRNHQRQRSPSDTH